MSAYDENAHDDSQFDRFLQRQGPLAERLQSLEQPAPPAALDAAILAQVERDLAGRERLVREASNDAVIPDAKAARPALWNRWRMPLGLAASVAVAVLVVLQWQTPGNDTPTHIAMAPEPPVASAGQSRDSSLSPGSPVQPQAPAESVKPDIKRRQSLQSTVPPTVIAQAEIPDQPGYVLRSAPPAPKALPPRDSASDAASSDTGDQLAKAGAKYPAKLWLELIEELLKAELRQDAQQEWKQFQKSYPKYPVPEKLKEQLNSLPDK